MNKVYHTFMAIPLTLFIYLITVLSARAGADSVIMGPGYANEVYYSFSRGIIKVSPRTGWDIAFRTKKLTSSVLINDGNGVVLYSYPKSDTSGWANMDTIGLSTWTPMYNDPDNWENGAFGRNATGGFDYGWGIYNLATHNLTGDSLYIIKMPEGSGYIYKKLWMVSKKSAANIYRFRYANLDNTHYKEVDLNLNPFVSADFYGYSLLTDQGVSFQPDKASWDILFTKYMSVQPNGTPYIVVGVLNNDTVSSKKFHPVAPGYNDFGAGKWDSTRSSIGWNWKVFDNNSFSYRIVDSSVYFVKQKNGDIYRLAFSGFSGTMSGITRFTSEKAAAAGISIRAGVPERLRVYPNPAVDYIHLDLQHIPLPILSITLTDLSGRQLRADRPEGKRVNPDVYTLDVTGVQTGTYLVTVVTAASSSVAKIFINR